MFTGIIEEIGKISQIRISKGNRVLAVRSKLAPEVADSISVNGACLTVVKSGADRFEVEVMAETLRSTTIARLRVGDAVNLESALVVGDRIGGHFVTGHIDEVGRIVSLRRHAGSVLMEISIKPGGFAYLVPKGSVAVDGVGLTVQELSRRGPVVALIPFTLNQTTLGRRRTGHNVNIEYDLIAKHIRTSPER